MMSTFIVGHRPFPLRKYLDKIKDLNRCIHALVGYTHSPHLRYYFSMKLSIQLDIPHESSLHAIPSRDPSPNGTSSPNPFSTLSTWSSSIQTPYCSASYPGTLIPCRRTPCPRMCTARCGCWIIWSVSERRQGRCILALIGRRA